MICGPHSDNEITFSELGNTYFERQIAIYCAKLHTTLCLILISPLS